MRVDLSINILEWYYPEKYKWSLRLDEVGLFTWFRGKIMLFTTYFGLLLSIFITPAYIFSYLLSLLSSYWEHIIALVFNINSLLTNDIKTAPADFRFPTTNQTRHCFTRYVEYHRCVNAKGDDAGDCEKFAKYYRSLCPGEWVEKWNEQRDNGTFPGPLWIYCPRPPLGPVNKLASPTVPFCIPTFRIVNAFCPLLFNQSPQNC